MPRQPRANIKISDITRDNIQSDDTEIIIQETELPVEPAPEQTIPKPRVRKPKPPTAEQQAEQQAIEQQLDSYKSSEVFQNELEDIDWTNPDRKALLTEVERKTQGSVSIDYLSMVYIAFQKIEDIINQKTNNKFVGLAKNLYEDYNIRKNMEILRIKYLSLDSEFVKLSPEYAMVLSIGFIAVKTYISNMNDDTEYEYEDE